MVLLKGIVILTVSLFLSTVRGIYNGYDAEPYIFPYQALIDVLDLHHESMWSCSGAIIDELFLITSAHCVYGARSFRIRLGAHLSGNNVDHLSYDYVIKSDPYLAPGYVANGIEHNVALIKLEEPIMYTPQIQPVNLTLDATFPKPYDPIWTYNNTDISPAEVHNAVATGWGPNNKNSSELQYLQMYVLDEHECTQSYDNFDFNTSLCAQGIGSLYFLKNGSLCREDGAPLVVKREILTLIGIYRSSMTGCQPGGPEIFTKIESYYDWIKGTIDRYYYFVEANDQRIYNLSIVST